MALIKEKNQTEQLMLSAQWENEACFTNLTEYGVVSLVPPEEKIGWIFGQKADY